MKTDIKPAPRDKSQKVAPSQPKPISPKPISNHEIPDGKDGDKLRGRRRMQDLENPDNPELSETRPIANPTAPVSSKIRAFGFVLSFLVIAIAALWGLHQWFEYGLKGGKMVAIACLGVCTMVVLTSYGFGARLIDSFLKRFFP